MKYLILKKSVITRMHSSRMCTGIGCMLESASGGGGVCSGGVCSQGVSALGGVCSWGVSVPRGVSTPRGGCGIPTCTEADTLPVDRITDACKNITLATTLLWLVINSQAKKRANYSKSICLTSLTCAKPKEKMEFPT